MSRLFLVNFLTPHEIFIWNLEAGKNNVTGIIKCFNDHTDFRLEDKPLLFKLLCSLFAELGCSTPSLKTSTWVSHWFFPYHNTYHPFPRALISTSRKTSPSL